MTIYHYHIDEMESAEPGACCYYPGYGYTADRSAARCHYYDMFARLRRRGILYARIMRVQDCPDEEYSSCGKRWGL